MRKQYYVHYPRGAANEYRLYYAETPEDFDLLPEGAERITRRAAEALCARERRARKENPEFAGYADAYIFPSAWTGRGDIPVCGYIFPRA